LHAFATVLDRDGLEFFVQRKLFRQCIPQFQIVIDYENLVCFCH